MRSSLTDTALLVRAGRGDARAARRLTERLAPRLHGLAGRMLGDRTEAEDVVQETMVRLWQEAPRWRPDGAQPGTWAWKVATNLCIDRLRRRRPVALEEVPEPPSDAPTADRGLMQAARATALRTAMEALPERQRLAVQLRDIEGMSNPEVAEVLEVSVEAVESLQARGRRALAAALRPRRAALGFTDDREEAS